mgnify:FL=1
MSCLILEVDLPAGVTIQQACKDAVALANRIGIKIKFEFNDKTVYALPDNNVNSLIDAYHDAIKTNQDFVCSFDKIY